VRQRRAGTGVFGADGVFLRWWITHSLWPLALCLALGFSAQGQISPGPLSKVHSSLNGTTQCSSCHVFGASTPTFKCLECHKEVAEALANRHGYHAQLKMQNPNGKECVRCHLEHNGEIFHLIRWEPSEQKFDHRATGYALEGKHAVVACEQCHVPAHMLGNLKPLIQYKDLSKSFFGQSTTCTPCHSDPHKGKLGNECAKCHVADSWKAASQFDHSKTRYPLTGLHSKVECENCHKPDALGGAARYQGLKFETCASCHNDPHRGEFKKTCESCHTTKGWRILSSEFTFDHSKTKYPLVGRHAQVACSACHLNDDFKKEIRFETCKDCHSHDPHAGQFNARPSKGECSECHTVDGWKPSLFGVKEHETSQYPLKGKHAQVECSQCHAPAGRDTAYKLKFGACADCHQDAHDNQFRAATYANRCESCHTVVDWHRTSYTIAKHQGTRFPLADAHAAIPCSDCHKAGLGGRTDKVLPFHFSDLSCTACHKDPHQGEFKLQMAKRRSSGIVFGCEACHSVKSWGDVSGFDHSKTKYPLTGAHRTVVCADCHRPVAASQSRFAGTPTICEACHKDVHDGQFTTKNGETNCAECHIPARWTPSTFDHDTKTHFSLTGGHANVPCAKCHVHTRSVGDKEVVVYKSVSGRCVDCHGNAPGKMAERHPGTQTQIFSVLAK
jgi:hypothetical protein